jgi:hypothetical protein
MYANGVSGSMQLDKSRAQIAVIDHASDHAIDDRNHALWIEVLFIIFAKIVYVLLLQISNSKSI